MNANVETLRNDCTVSAKEIIALRTVFPNASTDDLVDGILAVKNETAIAALEAQGEAVAWEGRIKAAKDCGPGEWQKVSKEIFDLNLKEELASLVFEYRELYAAPPSSPAMRAVVEALPNKWRNWAENEREKPVRATLIGCANDLDAVLAHPEVKKLMGETK